MGSRAAGKLAACSRFTTDRLGNILEADAEHVVEEKGGALQRRQTLQRHHQGQGDLVDLALLCLNYRFRQPRSEICFATVPRGLQVIEAKARHHAAQKCFRLANRVTVRVKPPEEGLLNHILCISDRSQHPVRDADQSWTQWIKSSSVAAIRHSRHQAA